MTKKGYVETKYIKNNNNNNKEYSITTTTPNTGSVGVMVSSKIPVWVKTVLDSNFINVSACIRDSLISRAKLISGSEQFDVKQNAKEMREKAKRIKEISAEIKRVTILEQESPILHKGICNRTYKLAMSELGLNRSEVYRLVYGGR